MIVDLIAGIDRGNLVAALVFLLVALGSGFVGVIYGRRSTPPEWWRS